MSRLTESLVGLCRAFVGFERDAVCCGTVTIAQCVVLQTLREGTWDVSSLAASTGVTNGAMTRLLDGLQKRGLIDRTRDEDDRRRVFIRLTATGEEEAARLAGLTEQGIAAILDRIPRGKRAQVIESIELLHGAVAEVRGRLPCC